jgi:hypothetical protein
MAVVIDNPPVAVPNGVDRLHASLGAPRVPPDMRDAHLGRRQHMRCLVPQYGTHVRSRRVRASRLHATAIGLAFLVTACGATAPSNPGSTNPTVPASPAASSEPVAPPPQASIGASPTPSAPARATPTPLPLPPRPSIGLGDLVTVISDGIRVRSKPRVAADSIRYEPLLAIGTDLSIVSGPVGASGYWWYKVHLEDGLRLEGGIELGWVAAGDHDGDPWIALVDDGMVGPDLEPAPDWIMPVPVVSAAGTEDYTVDGVVYTRYRLSVDNWSDFPDWLFEAEPDLDPCGSNTSASRTWVDILDGTTSAPLNGFCALSASQDLTALWFARLGGEAAPARVYVSILDRYSGQSAASELVDPSSSPSSSAAPS